MITAARMKETLGGSRVLRGAEDLDALADRVRAGLPCAALDAFARRFDIPLRELTTVLDLPERTLARRRTEGKLRADESDRLFRVGRVAALAEETSAPARSRPCCTGLSTGCSADPGLAADQAPSGGIRRRGVTSLRGTVEPSGGAGGLHCRPPLLGGPRGARPRDRCGGPTCGSRRHRRRCARRPSHRESQGRGSAAGLAEDSGTSCARGSRDRVAERREDGCASSTVRCGAVRVELHPESCSS